MRARLALALILMIPLTMFAFPKGKQEAESKGSVEAGEALFKKNCALCHHADSNEPKMGPGLKGLFKNKVLPSSHKLATESNVREQILEGNLKAKPMPMPPFAGKLKPEEVDSLIKYLKTL
jgi:mono/diheme cytochrome c family protein